MVDLVVLDPLSDNGWVPKQRTKVKIGEVDSGSERRLRTWTAFRREYSIPFSKLSVPRWIALMEFHELRGGPERGFLLWDVYRAYIPNERIGTGDGATKAFQLKKTISDAANSVVRTIRYPVPIGTPIPVNVLGLALSLGFPSGQTTATIVVTVGGVARADFTVSQSTGVLTFAGAAPAAGAAVVASFFAYVPVRFVDEELSVETSGVTGDNTSALIEVLNE